MSKKAIVSLMFTGLLVLLVTSTGLAAPTTPEIDGKLSRAIGQIISIGVNQFTIKTIRGQEKSITVDENTRYLSQQGAGAFADLEAGHWIILRAAQLGENSFTARIVVLMPENFTPIKSPENRHIGTIQSVNTDANSFIIKTSKDESISFLIDQGTKFLGSNDVTNLNTLPLNRWVVVVQGETNKDGKELARFILVLPENFTLNSPQNIRTGGTIQSLDLQKNTFTLLNLKGTTLVFKVNENTSFLSRGNKVSALGDLQINMRVTILGYKETDGSILALMVTAARPRFNNAGIPGVNISASAP